MSENQKRILQMLSEGRISVEEAQRLLALVNDRGDQDNTQGSASQGSKKLPRFIRVVVEPLAGAGDNRFGHHRHNRVNVRIPVSLIRAGMKFASLMPSETAEHVDRAFKEKGLSFDIKHLKDEDFQELISALEDSVIDINSDGEQIKIFSE